MITNPRWLKNRFDSMTAAEVAWRLRQLARAKRDCLPRSRRNAKAAGRVRQRLPALARSFKISYFNISHDWWGEDINWQGMTAMPETGDYHWHLIDYRNTERFGDPKLVWELNRHQFLRQWAIDPSIDPATKAIAISQLILQWIEKNPYGRGLNWCSSLEVAVRIVSWESAIETVGDDHFHPRVLLIIKDAIVEHVEHLLKYPSLHSSANNHRIGELLGRVAAAAFFPEEQELKSQGWEAWEELQTEAKLQITADGVSREKAMYYHIYVMLFLRRAIRYAEQLVFPVFLEVRQLADRMQWFLDASSDNHGHWFELGDRDDGDFSAFLPWDNEPHSLTFPAPDGLFPFTDAGIVVHRQSGVHALFRAGEFGYPVIAAHAHCDQLSVLLKINEVDILTDSGTCSYHDDEKWRRYFRGTSAHNTVRVNGTDQAEYGGPFLWNTTPTASLEVDGTGAVGTVSYETTKGPIQHTRRVDFQLAGNQILKVVDSIEPASREKSDNSCELIWNFGAGIEVHQEKSDSADQLAFLIRRGKLQLLRLELNCSSSAAIEYYYGNEMIPAGFLSRQFGQRTPICQLRVTASGKSVTFTSTFTRSTTD